MTHYAVLHGLDSNILIYSSHPMVKIMNPLSCKFVLYFCVNFKTHLDIYWLILGSRGIKSYSISTQLYFTVFIVCVEWSTIVCIEFSNVFAFIILLFFIGVKYFSARIACTSPWAILYKMSIWTLFLKIKIQPSRHQNKIVTALHCFVVADFNFIVKYK